MQIRKPNRQGRKESFQFQIKYPIPACPAAHAIPALVLDVALSEVAEDSIDAPVLSAVVVDALDFFLSIPVQLSCSSYGSSKRRSVKASS